MWDFRFFPKTTFLCDEYWSYCDSEPQNEDCGNCGPRGQDCLFCYPCISPFGLVYDTLSCPCRFSKKYCTCRQTTVEDENEN